MVDFKTLDTFLWVHKFGSFSRAADHLNTTQPAVSQRIAQLERSLGARLLNREHGCVVSLTPQGRKLLAYAERLVTLRDEMIASVGGASALGGTFRIGASETLVHTLVPDLLKKASTALPRLSLEMEVDITPRLLERLIARDIDLGLMLGPVELADLKSLPLARYPVAFIAHRSFVFPEAPCPLAEIAKWPVVTFPRKTTPFQTVEALLTKAKGAPARLHASASLAAATRMALDGVCIAAIPAAIVADELLSGELRIVETEERLPDLDFIACWRRDAESPACRSVLDLVQAATGV